jgi:hypothetical protein
MPIEAVSPVVPWTAQRHGTRIGYVQLQCELGSHERARLMAGKVRRTRAWKVVCDADQFTALKDREDFQQIVTLARLMNALRFAQTAIPKRPKRTPASDRQQTNAFFLLSALTFEGWQLIKRMAKHFRTLESWKTGFQQLLRDRQYQRLVSTSLKPLRNQGTFHFFEDEVRRRLQEHEVDDELVFLSGRGTKSAHAYYDLPDLLLLRTFIAQSGPDDELMRRADPLVTSASELVVKFLRAGDELIIEALSRMGFEEKPG